MKKLILLWMLFACADRCLAQQGVNRVKFPARNKNIVISAKDVSLDIVGYNGDEVVIQPQVPIPVSKVPAIASGLKLISTATNADSIFKPEILQETDKLLSIKLPASDFTSIKILIPKSANFFLEFAAPITAQNTASVKPPARLSLVNLNGELNIQAAASVIYLDHITGPLTLALNNNGSGIAGAQKIIISNLVLSKNKANNGGGPRSLINIVARYADVDIALPPMLKANIKADVTYGDLYSNIALLANDNGGAKGQYNGAINGGGDLIWIYATYGNIYLRKQQ